MVYYITDDGVSQLLKTKEDWERSLLGAALGAGYDGLKVDYLEERTATGRRAEGIRMIEEGFKRGWLTLDRSKRYTAGTWLVGGMDEPRPYTHEVL